MKETDNDWDLQPGDVPLNPAHVTQAMAATGQDKVAETAKAITAPAQVQPVAQQRQQEPEEFELPDNLRDTLDFLHDAEAELAKIPGNKRVIGNKQFVYVATALNRIRAHFHALQQGLPVVNVTAEHMAQSQKRRDEISNREIWEIRARADHHIADLLKAHDDLQKDLEAATAPKKK